MTKKTFIILPLIALFFTGGGMSKANNPATFDEGVIINGVRWATRNVDAPGIFARSPESTGMHFTWEEAQNACPSGWRLPTAAELWILTVVGGIDGGLWVQRNGVGGRLFGDPPRQIFIPAAGLFDGRYVASRYVAVGVLGSYWSSTSVYGNLVLGLRMTSRDLDFRVEIVGIRNSNILLSVRCVAIE